MNNDSRSNWICDICVNIFPFNNIISNESFVKNVTNNDTQPNLTCDKLLFNTFEVHEDNMDTQNMLPCTDTDPDQHYYSQLHDSQKLCDSKYYNIDEFNRATIRNVNYKKFSMYHCNIRSATKNGNNLSIHMKALNHEFDVIALTETWLNDLNSDIV